MPLRLWYPEQFYEESRVHFGVKTGDSGKNKTYFTALAEAYRLEELHVGNQFGSFFNELNAAIHAHIRFNVPWQFERFAAEGANEE